MLGRLDGFELPAHAWERAVLPARVDRYDAASLDMLCLSGQVGWSRLSAPIADGRIADASRGALPPQHADAWQTLRFANEAECAGRSSTTSTREPASCCETLKGRGASFLRDLRHAVPDERRSRTRCRVSR